MYIPVLVCCAGGDAGIVFLNMSGRCVFVAPNIATWHTAEQAVFLVPGECSPQCLALKDELQGQQLSGPGADSTYLILKHLTKRRFSQRGPTPSSPPGGGVQQPFSAPDPQSRR